MTKGWYKESKRHSLAAKGVKTKKKEVKTKVSPLYIPVRDYQIRKSDILDEVRRHIQETIINPDMYYPIDEDFRIVDMAIVGSRTKGTHTSESDIDVVVEYESHLREDTVFNILNDDEVRLKIFEIPVDINPIRADKSGTLKEWLKYNYNVEQKHHVVIK